jgi:long-chain-acyl-CoA dehydrogenase
MATGEILGALAMTEPGAGSDLRGIKTTAKKVDGGYLVNGAKTFISSGKTADIVVTFVKTGEGNRPDAFSLLILEDGMEGFDTARSSRRWASTGGTPPSSASPTCSSPRRTSSAARRAWASSSS